MLCLPSCAEMHRLTRIQLGICKPFLRFEMDERWRLEIAQEVKRSGDKTRYIGTARSATVQPIALYSSPCQFQWLFPENRHEVTLINMWHAWLDLRWSRASVLAPSQEHQSYPWVPGDGTYSAPTLHVLWGTCAAILGWSFDASRRRLDLFLEYRTAAHNGIVHHVTAAINKWRSHRSHVAVRAV